MNLSRKNQAQLISYPDALGGNLRALYQVLNQHFTDLFPGGVHILPPYPSSGDRGFAPLTYLDIEPRLGDWEDVRQISAQFPVVLDLMVNHISRHSTYFQDFARRGRKSAHAGMFITLDKVWPGGEPPAQDVACIFLRRPEHPFTDVQVEETGQVERVWATFGTRDWSEQIDLDVYAPETRELFRQILAHFSRNGVKMVRLDAVAYVTKKPGTDCFFVEPEIYQFLDWITGEAAAVEIELLPEVHARPEIQARLAAHGERVYNFVLPFLVLHSLLEGTSAALKAHLQTCPRNQVTMLDCHDGIPVQPDIEGVVLVEEARRTVATCLERGANLSRLFSPAQRQSPEFDVHQINCTYYSALGENDNAYIAARAIQFFAPGQPQVYYLGLLAGENDQAEVQRTGERRAINRRNYTLEEIDLAVRKPVVQRLFALIRFRNSMPAFEGRFQVEDSQEGTLQLAWQGEKSACRLRVDLRSYQCMIEYLSEDGKLREYRP